MYIIYMLHDAPFTSLHIRVEIRQPCTHDSVINVLSTHDHYHAANAWIHLFRSTCSNSNNTIIIMWIRLFKSTCSNSNNTICGFAFLNQHVVTATIPYVWYIYSNVCTDNRKEMLVNPSARSDWGRLPHLYNNSAP